MTKYIGNAFSPQMLRNPNCLVAVHEITRKEFELWTHNAISVVGNQTLANVLNIEYNRENIVLNYGDTLFVAQVHGGKLPDEVKTLPKGITFKFYCIKMLESLIIKKIDEKGVV